MTSTIATRDGRTLSYLEVGDPQGPLVIHNHGGPTALRGTKNDGGGVIGHGLRPEMPKAHALKPAISPPVDSTNRTMAARRSSEVKATLLITVAITF